jgi:hypothetical protein
MKQIGIAAIALALFSLGPQTSAQTATPFMTIDAVDMGASSIRVTGVADGAAAPSTRTIEFTVYGTEAQKAAALDACHRRLLLALSRPGQYVVQAGTNLCKVALVAP